MRGFGELGHTLTLHHNGMYRLHRQLQGKYPIASLHHNDMCYKQQAEDMMLNALNTPNIF
jgi:hypothetical protein